MAYNWAQLAFVEKWRQNAVRGRLVGMYRPDTTTLFDLRLYPGEGGVGRLPGPIELRLVDAGDLIREKRLPLLERLPVVVRVVASAVVANPPDPDPVEEKPPASRSRHWLDAGNTISARVALHDGDTLLVDAGFPLVVELPAGGCTPAPRPGQSVHFTVSEPPKGFIVV